MCLQGEADANKVSEQVALGYTPAKAATTGVNDVVKHLGLQIFALGVMKNRGICFVAASARTITAYLDGIDTWGLVTFFGFPPSPDQQMPRMVLYSQRRTYNLWRRLHSCW